MDENFMRTYANRRGDYLEFTCENGDELLMPCDGSGPVKRIPAGARRKLLDEILGMVDDGLLKMEVHEDGSASLSIGD
jgi:hypothetical protein